MMLMVNRVGQEGRIRMVDDIVCVRGMAAGLMFSTGLWLLMSAAAFVLRAL